MIFSSMPNKVLVLGTKVEMIYSSRDLLYSDIWTLQGMCLSGKFEWFIFYYYFYYYFSLPVKPSNSNSKFVIGIWLLFLMAKFSWIHPEMKLKCAFTLCRAVISTAVSCLPDPTLGEKGVWMWDRSGIWRFVTANFLCHLGKSCPQLQFS